jgi:hypothetical protein
MKNNLSSRKVEMKGAIISKKALYVANFQLCLPVMATGLGVLAKPDVNHFATKRQLNWRISRPSGPVSQPEDEGLKRVLELGESLALLLLAIPLLVLHHS